MTSAFLPLVSPALSVVVAGIVGCVAWTQMRIAREKLRADLFDRRFAIFDTHYRMVSQVLSMGGSEPGSGDETIAAATIGASGATFLLDKELAEYLDDLRRAAMMCLVLETSMIAGMGTDGDARTRTKNERAEQAREHLSSEGDMLIEYFEPYLRLHAMTRLPPQRRHRIRMPTIGEM